MVQKTVRRQLLLTTLVVVSLVIAACQRSGRQAGPAVSSPSAVVSAGAVARGGQTQPGASSATAARPAVPQPASQIVPQSQNAIVLNKEAASAAPRVASFSDPAALMALGRSKRILPEDFKIGLLGDERSGATDQGNAMATAEKFLESIVAGTLDTTIIAPDSQAAITDSLSFEMARGNRPTAYRIGAPKSRDDGEITATVRVFGDHSSSEGEIYLATSGRQWVVADIQISLGELAVKKEKSKDKYFPSEYRWLLEE